jgi:hypothetical protein
LTDILAKFDQRIAHEVFGNMVASPAEATPSPQKEFARSGSRPTASSTCTDVAIFPEVIWDVNRYYRLLDLSFPFRPLTKKDLRLAYSAVDGQGSGQVTFAFKQLLNPDIRQRYDKSSLGVLFPDVYVADEIKRRAAQVAGDRNKTGGETDLDEVLHEMGYEKDPSLSEGIAEEDSDTPSLPPDYWGWSYFLWRSSKRDDHVMRNWQTLLIPFLRVHGVRRFAVGFMGKQPHPYATATVEDQFVVFLNEDEEPTLDLAARVAASIVVTDENAGDIMTNAIPTFRRGGQAAKEASEEINSGRFARKNFLRLADGERTILRFIDDEPEWASVAQHGLADTKGAPPDMDKEAAGRWPKRMSATCRADKEIKDLFPDGCYICQNLTNERGKPETPSLRLWARAVEREEIIGTQEMVSESEEEIRAGRAIPQYKVGKPVGYRDVETDIPELDEKGKPTGRMVRGKKIIIVNMGLKNFFSKLQGAANVYGTVVDRDYSIRRVNGKTVTDTDYEIVGLDPIKDHDLGDPQTKRIYLEHAERAGVGSLDAMIWERANDEWYGRWFDPALPFPVWERDGDDAPAQQKATPAARTPQQAASRPQQSAPAQQATAPRTSAPQPNGDALAAMKARVIKSAGRQQPEADTGQTEQSAQGDDIASPINFTN